MRSTSRLVIQHPERYAAEAIDGGTPPDVAERADRVGDTILIQPVETPQVEQAPSRLEVIDPTLTIVHAPSSRQSSRSPGPPPSPRPRRRQRSRAVAFVCTRDFEPVATWPSSRRLPIPARAIEPCDPDNATRTFCTPQIRRPTLCRARAGSGLRAAFDVQVLAALVVAERPREAIGGDGDQVIEVERPHAGDAVVAH